MRGWLLVGAGVFSSLKMEPPSRLAGRGILLLPVLLVALGMMDTARCIRTRWSFYHAGVLLSLYADVMALLLVLFLFVYPFFV